ncbi:MAG: DNA sulfur modification protein DndD, partial [Bacteroidia bacterium]|nr:DNA sulfur modification protein DndD [Bacteroidia bacterium]
MTVEQLNELRQERANLEAKLEQLQERLKDFYDLIPLGLAGELLTDVAEQLTYERKHKANKFKEEDVEKKIDEILEELEEEKRNLNIPVTRSIRDFYEKQIKELIRKHFFADVPKTETFKILHDFSDAKTNEFIALVQNLKTSFKDSFKNLYAEYSQTKSQIEQIARNINQAERDADNDYISELRNKKENLDKQIGSIEDQIISLKAKRLNLVEEMKALRQKQESLRKKIDASRRFSAMDEKAQQVIARLRQFIKTFKEEKNNLLNATF